MGEMKKCMVGDEGVVFVYVDFGYFDNRKVIILIKVG